MPELPEVETTRRGLLPLVGKIVKSVTIRHPTLRWPIPQHLPQTLPNQTLSGLTRRAKYILCEFGDESSGGVLLLHLGMSGRIQLLDCNYPPEKHDHFDIEFLDGQVLRLRDPRRFGAVLWVDNKDNSHALLNSLGPEPLEASFNAKYLHKALSNKTLAIKNAIMDGHVVVGVGNIYASESLFRARIHPETPANKLSLKQYEKLVTEIKSTLQDALSAGGSSLRDFFGTDGNPGYFQQEYFVYGRTGEPCKVCAKSIKCIRLGQRSTFYCEHCQQR
ncbi:bifunctional DNA-formamidopyrimidine glycosylase/DNA-(apurinic or apyrimidinic site) lyase [Methylotenera sp.]|jgi:formamidopyrimidine-DNA glycosylase|uniref:bifunctional DNA-formamidopyrimidine glycosylase/DNA-(apurinic or apyrimidinic site) lyase n=1 Tax=Methylotenera sp. TaxID=2051956 RepID=UPI0027273D58|nr:bifunctional DNA-formamidopyrimidine glycosylase/DNA-(apurinic or apyrimidinic site) lyase [Methylotenera sp.]MDO9206142.1 bifunctional DNA-formamidopyrimidine glycosylase/DNA-(apurinic or apyrimidinic site) lyase [Methylotenera sp.]MDP1522982.1 bifunctional DNA-formamidopyrimidine glycosylase/DNA-(apurinic or apyrimidinic site) lyase [Methylotenera sp.]MDP2070918.1 bifunctional DNA-formamidopyrimidine glycosylase/DNA-(apurinic or apyrimidinic site) lyase [Methylotenera sp.]MDP2230272.1 bifu